MMTSPLLDLEFRDLTGFHGAKASFDSHRRQFRVTKRLCAKKDCLQPGSHKEEGVEDDDTKGNEMRLDCHIPCGEG